MHGKQHLLLHEHVLLLKSMDESQGTGRDLSLDAELRDNRDRTLRMSTWIPRPKGARAGMAIGFSLVSFQRDQPDNRRLWPVGLRAMVKLQDAVCSPAGAPPRLEVGMYFCHS